MIVENNNTSSIRGVIKAGFEKISAIFKNKTGFFNKYEQPIEGWQYYNHAAIPTVAPDTIVDLSPINNGSIWNINGNIPLFARYTTDYDCNVDTGWYYIIKDNFYDINKIRSKKKYNINKGRKHFYIKKIDPKKFAQEIASIQEDAFEGYSSLNPVTFSKQNCIDNISNGSFDSLVVFGAFDKETNDLCGFYTVKVDKKCIYLIQLKVYRNKEKQRINYALVDGLLSAFADYQAKGYYFSNGCRNLNHLTNFNELLCENFGFRKAFCKLHMVYPWYLKPCIYILFLFRRYIKSITINIICFTKLTQFLKWKRLQDNVENRSLANE